MRRAWLLSVLSGCELIVGSGDSSPLVLDRLTITPGKIDQAVDGDTLHYTATVPITDSVKISAHSPDPDVVIELTGIDPPVPSIGNGASSAPIPVNGGPNTIAFRLRAMQVGVETSYTIGVNVGGARFAAPVSHPLNFSEMVVAMATADVNGDGTPDLIVGFAGKGFAVYNGKTFNQIGGRVGVPGFTSLAVADLDNASGPDVVATAGGGTASVFLNHGGGTFPAADSQIGSGTHFTEIAIGTIDGDANLDIMLADQQNQSEFAGAQQWMLGNGDGTFGTAKALPAGAHPAGMAIGDLDSAAGHDVMVLAGIHPGLTLMRGDGAGDLAIHGATSTFNGIPEPTTAKALALGSFDDNPVPDYALLHADKNELRVITNFAGDDTVTADFAETSFATCDGASALLTADLDGDGNQDLVVPCTNNSQLILFYGDGHAGFIPVHLAVGNGPTAAAIGDFNNDGRPDIVTANAMNSDLTVLLQEAP